jgi:hypothetical protein
LLLSNTSEERELNYCRLIESASGAGRISISLLFFNEMMTIILNRCGSACLIRMQQLHYYRYFPL